MEIARGNDVRDGWVAEERGDLTEEIAAAEPSLLLAVDANDGLARKDHVEAGSGEALTQDALALGETTLVNDVRYRFELGRTEIGEQREAGELVAELAAGRCHRHMSRPAPVGWQLGERERTIET